MTSTLKAKAQQAAAQSWGETTPGEVAAHTIDPPAPVVAETLPDINYTGDIRDAEQVPVHVAFARVMADVQSIAKGDQRSDSGGRYSFRGVDRVVNAVGPALRRHGLLVVPVCIYDVVYRDGKTKAGGTMQDVNLKVKWQVIGPKGDTLPELLESAGQANDTADKGTAKAVSVAQRVLFLAAMHIPTDDPTIDEGHDRGERPAVRPGQYVEEITDPRTSLARLRQIRSEINQHGIGNALVTNENGDEERLLTMVARIGQARAAEGGGE